MFLKKGVHICQLGTDTLKRTFDLFVEDNRGNNHQRHHNQTGKSQLPAGHKHHNQDSNDGNDISNDGEQTFRKNRLDTLNIIDDAGDVHTGWSLVKLSDSLTYNFIEYFDTQVSGNMNSERLSEIIKENEGLLPQ